MLFSFCVSLWSMWCQPWPCILVAAAGQVAAVSWHLSGCPWKVFSASFHQGIVPLSWGFPIWTGSSHVRCSNAERQPPSPLHPSSCAPSSHPLPWPITPASSPSLSQTFAPTSPFQLLLEGCWETGSPGGAVCVCTWQGRCRDCRRVHRDAEVMLWDFLGIFLLGRWLPPVCYPSVVEQKDAWNQHSFFCLLSPPSSFAEAWSSTLYIMQNNAIIYSYRWIIPYYCLWLMKDLTKPVRSFLFHSAYSTLS